MEVKLSQYKMDNIDAGDSTKPVNMEKGFGSMCHATNEVLPKEGISSGLCRLQRAHPLQMSEDWCNWKTKILEVEQ